MPDSAPDAPRPARRCRRPVRPRPPPRRTGRRRRSRQAPPGRPRRRARRRRRADARPSRQAAAASDDPPPSPAAAGIRFSRRQADRGPAPGRGRRGGRARRGSARRAAASLPRRPSTRRPLHPGSRSQPIGQIEQDELAVEEVKAVVATSDDPQREVELRRRLEAERRSRLDLRAPMPGRPTRRLLSVWGRRSPSTPHRSSAAATASRETGSSRTSPLWTCLRRWRNPAWTTR